MVGGKEWNCVIEQEQRIAIAKMCGWHCLECGNTGEKADYSFGDSTKTIIRKCSHKFMPKYTEDLNAMHSAVMSLNPEQLARYEQLMQERFGFTKALTATAEQQAEQFLKALNLWKD